MNSFLPYYIFLFLILFSCASSLGIHEQFFQCLSRKSIDNGIFTPANLSYASILESRIQNLRFNTTDTPKPLAIITPLGVSHIQNTIICARKYKLQIRIRSGGHDFEGLSYVSPLPFIVLDLVNLRNITVDAENRVAWVESGATLGELYYRIAEKSRTLAFPAGSWSTVGVGGQLGGGGYGILLRKYGLAADNIVDALLVDVNGRVLDRASMGEDLFWAIRGAGQNSFGVVISWKVNLVPVPPTVTLCTVVKWFEQSTIKLLNRSQYVANKLPDEISFLIIARSRNPARFVAFVSMYLGGIDSLLPLMEERFPELGLKREDCSEMSWIEAQVYFQGFPSNSSLDILLNKTNEGLRKFKVKSDYVKEPMPEAAFESLLKWLSNEKIKYSELLIVPYGGKMDEIAETSIPFPHRAGNLYMMAYTLGWDEEGTEATRYHINWLRKIYAYMAPYVSKNPREAYLNYRDLDIGTNNLSGNTSYKRASVWGTKYFKNNFDRLVRVKTIVDPSNFFKNEQSIPPLSDGDFITSSVKLNIKQFE